MFGLQDDTQKTNDDPAMLDNVKDLASQPASAVEPPQLPTDDASSAQASPDPSVSGFTSPATTPTTVATDTASTQEPLGHPEIAEGFSSNPIIDNPEPPTPSPDPVVATDDSNSSEESTEQDSPKEYPEIKSTSGPMITSQPSPVQNDVSAPPAPTEVETPSVDSTESPEPKVEEVDHEHLANLKQEALGHLEGLSDHIDGSPEEVFKTTMQLIQANDNHKLIEKALKAAKEIEDDKVRAQAMLDIINEINYFSQSS